MRLIVSKTGKRWRCIRSIELAGKAVADREEFGRHVTAINKAEAEEKARKSSNPERFAGLYPKVSNAGRARWRKESSGNSHA